MEDFFKSERPLHGTNESYGRWRRRRSIKDSIQNGVIVIEFNDGRFADTAVFYSGAQRFTYLRFYNVAQLKKTPSGNFDLPGRDKIFLICKQ